MAKTILELEKTVTPTMLAAGLRGDEQAHIDGMTLEQKIKRIYAEMEFARRAQEQPSK